MAESYLTRKNSAEKARRWIGQAERHPRRRIRFEFRRSSSALLVLDMQNFFLDRRSHAFVPAAKVILPNIQKLIDAFRRAGRPVVFTRHALLASEDAGMMGRFWRDVVREGSQESRLSSELKRNRKETVLRKTRYSAFLGTDLEKILARSRVSTVAITGVVTHLCCESTARDAFARDLEVWLVADGTASWTEDLHLSSLKSISDGIAIVTTTQEILACFSEVQDEKD